jgi:O-antigen/teichoic acid export membrane protein
LGERLLKRKMPTLLIAGKTLLPEEYGILSTSINFALIFSGMSLLGLNLTMMKLLPEYLSKKQDEKIVLLSRFSLKIVFLSNLAITLFLLLFSNYIADWIKAPVQVVWISALILLATSFSSLLGAIVYGFQEMRKFFLSDFFGQLVKIVISILLIFLGFSYFGPLLALLFSFLLVTIIRLKFSYSYFFTQAKEIINGKEIMLDYAFPAFASFLAWTLFLNGQYVLLTILKNPQITGIFTVAMIPTSIVTTFPSVLNTALFPLISFLSSDKNSKKRQNHLIQLVFRYALFLSLPVATLLVIFSKQVILIFSSSKYLEASALFPILALGALIYGLGNIFHSSLYAIGKTKVHRNIVFFFYCFNYIAIFISYLNC